ncbi:nucleotide kinase domain-containing protein [Flavobacterium sp. 22076]|uniref:nucleotide kinase domain-containing protein n=1 Tax=unclassified Flavobacterium TaxID=196869 RepID=UPI003F8360DF
MKNIIILNKKLKPKTSTIYDTYWKFATERQNIFFKRFKNSQYPWSTDFILNEYKFTNTYRATDRVSQYLIKNIIYKGNQTPSEVFFRIILFKIFNKIETWEFLEHELKEISWKTYSFNKYNSILSELMNNKIPIYSAAYIMASGKSSFYEIKKHQNHLKLLEMMMNNDIVNTLMETDNMATGYNILKEYPTIGEFLAYQYITDINYSNLTSYSEQEFTKAGPGAKDGITKCFSSLREYNYEDVIKMMSDIQELEFQRLDLEFNNLWGRPLQLIDIQNIFCEVDKYSRVAHSDILGKSNRTRIKQKFKFEEKEKIELFFPPKWNINHLII